LRRAEAFLVDLSREAFNRDTREGESVKVSDKGYVIIVIVSIDTLID
jgi:hypothetical protein